MAKNNLPTYGAPGWGATLNNYLRELEGRTSALESRLSTNTESDVTTVNTNYSGTGLITNDMKVYTQSSGENQNRVAKTETFALNEGSSLYFSNVNIFFEKTFTSQAKIFKHAGDLIYTIPALYEGVSVVTLSYDENNTLSVQIAGSIEETNQNTNLSDTTCRLGYLTKIGSNIYYTPSPAIANISFNDKIFLINNPSFRLYMNSTLPPLIAGGTLDTTIHPFDFSNEGLNYHKVSSTQEIISSLYYEDYCIHRYERDEGLSQYFMISINEQEEEVINTFGAPTLSKDYIYVYYVTLAGIVFVYQYRNPSNIVNKAALASEPIPMPSLLKTNYKWLQPIEAMRVTVSPYGSVITHMQGYMGISPQVPSVPPVAAIESRKWEHFSLWMDENNDDISSSIRFKPYVKNQDVTKNTIIINTSGNSVGETDSPGAFLYNYEFGEDLHFGASGADAKNNSIFSIVNEPTDDREYLQEGYRLKFNPNIYCLGGLTFRDNTADTFSKLNYNSFSIQDTQSKGATFLGFDGLITRSDTTYFSIDNEAFQGDPNLRFGIGKLKISANINSLNFDSYDFDSYIKIDRAGMEFFSNVNIDFKSRVSFAKDVLISNDSCLQINYILSDRKYKFEVDSDGNCAMVGDCSANSFIVTSDVRHKNLHSPFVDSGIDIIHQLPIYNYSLKTQPDKRTIGITAQDLQQVLPQLVDTSDESHYKINESKLVYVCMQAIKELHTEVSILKRQLKDLRGE